MPLHENRDYPAIASHAFPRRPRGHWPRGAWENSSAISSACLQGEREYGY